MFLRLKSPLYLIPLFAVLIAVAISALYVTPARAAFCQPGEYYSGFFTCSDAEPGFYAPGDDQRYLCPVGFYTPGYGYTSCIPAPAGKYVSSIGSSSATSCSPGTYQPSSGQSSCITTPPGYYSGTGYAIPVACPVGNFQPNSGSAGCIQASPGYYVNTIAATAPTPCAAGTYQTSFGQASCIPAPAGRYVASPGWGGLPLACSVGFYQPATGQTSCIAADPGYYVASTASTAQNACALGTYQPLSGKASCNLADPGYYVDTVGATEQTMCPAGTTSDAGASECTPLDTTAPTITITTPADGATYFLGEAVNADYSCQDEDGGSGVASCDGTLANGTALDTSVVGAQSFTVDAEDNAGNPASLTYNYSVIYNFSGFLSPVNGDMVNQAKAGQAVPIKFSLSGDFGLGILASGYPKFKTMACPSGDPEVPVEEIADTAGQSGLSYNADIDQYTYVWKTDKKWAKKCGTLTLKLNDGSEYTAGFMFTK